MQFETEKSDSEMTIYIQEGTSRFDGNSTTQLSIDDVPFAKNFLRYNHLGSPHAYLLEEFAKRASAEFRPWLEWLNRTSADDQVSFRLSFEDGTNFKAYIAESSSSESAHRNCAIVIGLGSLPTLFGIANRLFSLARNDLFQHSQQTMDMADGWRPSIDPIGMLLQGSNGYAETFRIALDALILIFLHEAAHGLRAHAHLGNDAIRSPSTRRAIESDADWGSGLLFITGALAGIPGFTQVSTFPGQGELIQRLYMASLCTYMSLQACMKGDPARSLYHLPPTRLACTLSGAKQAWNESLGDYIRFDTHTAITAFEIRNIGFMSDLYENWIDPEDQMSVQDRHLCGTSSQFILNRLLPTVAKRSAAPLKGKLAYYALNGYRHVAPYHLTPTYRRMNSQTAMPLVAFPKSCHLGFSAPYWGIG